MILPNNPSIDVDELMNRVRADAARLRESGAVQARRNEPRIPREGRLAQAVDRHRTVTALLNLAEKENAARTAVPPRIAALRALRPAAAFALRVFNYTFKQQREFNATMLRAARESILLLVRVGEAVTRLERAGDPWNLDALADRLGRLERELGRLDPVRLQQMDGMRNQLHAFEAHAQLAQARLEAAETALAELRASAHERIELTRSRSDFAHERIDSLESTQRALSARLEASPTGMEVRRDIVDALRETEHRLAVATESLLRNEAILRGELLALRRSIDLEPRSGQPSQPSPPLAPFAGDALHAALGDAFRGDRELVSERLAAYIPLVREAAVSAEHPVLDIGSGRGEWLAALRAQGIAARGCDSNELLVHQAVEAGLDVRHADGLDVLRAVPAGSLGAVTAFHVIEHLTFDELCLLLSQAQRALVPGGLLILETPDPRNILVSTRTFYLDPTHRHPVPAELLEFLVSALGFARISQQQLHPPDTALFDPDDAAGKTLNTLFSTAQDYAVIAYAPRS